MLDLIIWASFSVVAVVLAVVSSIGFHLIFVFGVVALALIPLITGVICSPRRARRTKRQFMLYAITLALLGATWYTYVLMDTAPCSKSSCSHATQLPVIYNPRGYFPDTFGSYQPTSLDLMMCPRPRCRWADSSGLFPIGFSLQALLLETYDVPGPYATTRPQDYPDAGGGLAQGYTTGSSKISNIALCPGHGDQICPRCLQYWRDNGYQDADPLSCPTSLYKNTPAGLCFACPHPDSNMNLVVASYWVLVSMALLLCVV